VLESVIGEPSQLGFLPDGLGGALDIPELLEELWVVSLQLPFEETRRHFRLEYSDRETNHRHFLLQP
jgi:hypothetical protein